MCVFYVPEPNVERRRVNVHVVDVKQSRAGWTWQARHGKPHDSAF